jgi:hypothetical protein
MRITARKTANAQLITKTQSFVFDMHPKKLDSFAGAYFLWVKEKGKIENARRMQTATSSRNGVKIY